MFENLAYSLLGLGEAGLSAVAFSVLLVGSIFGVSAGSEENRLRRAPYFAWYGFLSLFISIAFLPFVFMIDAVVGRFVWFLLILTGAWLVVAGILLGHTGAARARDIGWNRWTALFALVPFLCLVLLMKGSSDRDRPDPHMLAGIPGALIGFVLFMMSFSAVPYLEELAIQREAQRPLTPDQEATYVNFQVGLVGIDDVLRTMADEAVLPIHVDETTILAQIGASGNMLTRVYLVREHESGLEMNDFWAYDITAFLCDDTFFAALLSAGAVIRESYVYESGAPIGSVEVSALSCANYT
ncbi:hypothetical protein AADZ90_009720 [Aestuariibius sp. 2305UL40-4]|uniref:hypothetical protein n=1 Tax=Aestuariibius violaceus TaxID=3234132 RepID=UPI00345E74D9